MCYAKTGKFNGQKVSGAGDFDCCPEYQIERTWTAVDCAGNTTTFTQTINVGGLTGSDFVACMGDFNFDGSITTSDLTMLLGDLGCVGLCDCDLNFDNAVNTGDLVLFLSVFGGSCD